MASVRKHHELLCIALALLGARATVAGTQPRMPGVRGPRPAVRPVAPPPPAPRPMPGSLATMPLDLGEDEDAPIPVPAIPTPLRPGGPAFAGGHPFPLTWPVNGQVISPFGPRRHKFHMGVDIKAPRGTPILAAADGEVVGAGVLRGHGKVVAVMHDNGFLTLYTHNDRNIVMRGRVARGQPIALVGATGNATTPHVHFEVRDHGRRVDPMQFLKIRQLASR